MLSLSDSRMVRSSSNVCTLILERRRKSRVYLTFLISNTCLYHTVITKFASTVNVCSLVHWFIHVFWVLMGVVS